MDYGVSVGWRDGMHVGTDLHMDIAAVFLGKNNNNKRMGAAWLIYNLPRWT